MKNISRRDFIKYMGAGTIGLIVNPKIKQPGKKASLQTSDVIQCFDDNATSGSTINNSVVQIMMDESIKTLTGINDIGEAWKSIFPGISETSIISIKVNAAWYPIPAHKAFVDCIINGLAQMQFGGNYFKKNNVIIWDRTDSDLSTAGYTIYDGTDPDTVRCFGSSHAGVGYDSTCQLRVNYQGGTYTKYPSRIMSMLSDYLISVPVLKNHTGAQITLNLKNHYGSIDQPVGNPLHYNLCNPSLPSLNQQIRDIVTPNNIIKIFIIDALFGSVVDGPTGNPDWNPKKVIMSLDPIACDYQGWNIINEERVGSGYSPITWPVYQLETGSQSPYNLGTTNINLIQINNPSGIAETEINASANNGLKVNPNPFKSKTTLILNMDTGSAVYLDLIDASGRIQQKIFQGDLNAGNHILNLNVKKTLCAGTYFIRLYKQGTTSFAKAIIIN
jgi:hypothetical protein